MVVIKGKGTLSVTEPGHDRGTYYEKAEISVYDTVVHFSAYGKFHTAAANMCMIGWDEKPEVTVSAG